LSIPQMTELGKAGMYLNFTYDELSPLLGVDPFDMYKAIRSIGVEQVTLSSDCGEPLFPNSVEGVRQMRAYMEAFGLSKEEIKTVSCDNPAKILGLPAAA
jgi:predicted metal-dependent TIM-barrel fold hydrolase